MAQKKKSKKQQPPARRQPRLTRDAVPPKLAQSLDEAYKLMEEEDYEEAIDMLLQLDTRYPRQYYVLNMLVVASQKLDDLNHLMYACENMVQTDPSDPNYWLILAGTYIETGYSLLAVQTMEQFIKRFPRHEEVQRSQYTIEQIEAQFVESYEREKKTDIPYDDAREIARFSEQIQVHFNYGRFVAARREAEVLVRRWPGYLRGLNLLSLTYFGEHNLSRAIELAKRVLDTEPNNCHALSNLIHYYCVVGDLDVVYATTEQLAQVDVTDLDIAIKKAEGLSYVGREQDVLDTFYQVQDAGLLENSRYPNLALLYHFAAVAALRLDPVENEDEAREYWGEALEISPDLDVVARNLDEFDSSLHETHAPWAFEFSNWVTPKMQEDMMRLLQATTDVTEQQKISIAQRMLRKYPKLINLVPIWLDRGDAGARDFALLLAQAVRSPKTMHALRDFALGQRGPLQLRMQAARIALDAGEIEPGTIRVWSQGKWCDIMLLDFNVTMEPVDQPFAPEVQKLVAEGFMASERGDYKTALALYEQAHELEPDSPSILFNIAVGYEVVGRVAEASDLLLQIFENHPDYLFARVGIARKHIKAGALDEAKALLDPLLHTKTFHFSEFRSVCLGYVELLEAKEELEGALSWLSMWEQVEPEHPAMKTLKTRIQRQINPLNFVTVGGDTYATTPELANAPNILNWLRKHLPKR